MQQSDEIAENELWDNAQGRAVIEWRGREKNMQQDVVSDFLMEEGKTR
jgi:hypothetical protein